MRCLTYRCLKVLKYRCYVFMHQETGAFQAKSRCWTQRCFHQTSNSQWKKLLVMWTSIIDWTLSIICFRSNSNAFNRTLSIERFQSNALNQTLWIKRFQLNAFNQTLWTLNQTLSIKRFLFQSNAFNQTLSIERFRYILDDLTFGNFFHCAIWKAVNFTLLCMKLTFFTGVCALIPGPASRMEAVVELSCNTASGLSGVVPWLLIRPRFWMSKFLSLSSSRLQNKFRI